MEVKKNPRSSSLELCRIICMFLIIMHHCVVHGGAIGMNVCLNKYITFFLFPGGKICFNAFIALSMWFLVDSEFKTQRFVKTWIQVLFYSILFTFVAYSFGSDISFRNWISVFFPITGNSHGFAAAYLAFYLLLPFLSKISNNITKKENIHIVVLLFIFQIFAQMMGAFTQYNQHLFSELQLFIFCYFTLLLLKRSHFSFLNKKAFLLLIFFVIWIFTWIIRCIQIFYPNSQIIGYLVFLTSDESSILNIIAGTALFFFFLSLNIKTNKVINAIATTTFGILLIHDHNFFRYVLWPKIFHTSSWFYSKYFTCFVILSSLTIFVVCMFFDFFRNFIFEKIYKKTDFLKKIKTKLMDVSLILSNNSKNKKKYIFGIMFIGILLCIIVNITNIPNIIRIKTKYEKFFKKKYSLTDNNMDNSLYIFKNARAFSSINKNSAYIDISKTDLKKDSNKIIDILEINDKNVLIESKPFFDLIDINEKGMEKILSNRYLLEGKDDKFIFLKNKKNEKNINIKNIIIKFLDGFTLNKYSFDKSKIMIFNPYEDNLKISMNISIYSSTGGKISIKTQNDKFDFNLNKGKNDTTIVLSLNKGRNVAILETLGSKYFDKDFSVSYNKSFALDINSIAFENNILNKLSEINLNNETYLISLNQEKENNLKVLEKLSINKKQISETTFYETFLLLKKEKKNFIISKNSLSKIIKKNSVSLSQCIKDNYICIADDAENLLYKYVEYPVDFIPSNIIFLYGKGFEKDNYTVKMLAKDNSELLIFNPYDSFEGILNIAGEGFDFSDGLEITINNVKKLYKFDNKKANILEQLKIPSGLTKVTITKPYLESGDDKYGIFMIDKLSITNISKKYVIGINDIDLDNTMFTNNITEIPNLTKQNIITDTKKYIDFDPNNNIEFKNFNVSQYNDENLQIENIGIKYEPFKQNDIIVYNGNGIIILRDNKHYGSDKSEIIFYNPYSIDLQAKLLLNINLIGNDLTNGYIAANMNEKLKKYDFVNKKAEIRENVVFRPGKNILHLNCYGLNDSLEINGIKYYYSYDQAELQLDYLDYFMKKNKIDAINTQIIIEKGYLTTQELPYFSLSNDVLEKKEFWFALFENAIIKHKDIIISKNRLGLLTSDTNKGLNKLTAFYDYQFSNNSFIYLKYKHNKDVSAQKVWMFYGNGRNSIDGKSIAFHNEKAILYIFNSDKENRKAKISLNIKLPYYKPECSYAMKIQSADPLRFHETSQENKGERYTKINRNNLDVEQEIVLGYGLNAIMLEVMTTDKILYIINDSKIDVIR